LSISFLSGAIDYKNSRDEDFPTNVLKGVPTETQVLKQSKKLLPQFGISLAEVSKRENGLEPGLSVSTAGGMYFPR